MYSYIKGIVTNSNALSITLENQGIGYLIRVANPYDYELNGSLIVYLYQHVREDAIELFGFKTSDERDMFVKLINVKGLGPKGALAILASATPKEIASAIEESNATYFNHFPGIGPKSSQQIILDLKGKVSFDNEISPRNKKLEDISAALKSLGYNNSEIKNAVKNLSISDNDDLAIVLKQVLRSLQKK